MAVYFLQVGGDPMDAPVRIGFTTNLARRLISLQAGHYRDYAVLRVIEGAPSDELRVHRMFQHLRIRGEWFRFDAAMFGDLGARDLPRPVTPVRTLRGSPMPQAHRAAIIAGQARSRANGRMLETRLQQAASAIIANSVSA